MNEVSHYTFWELSFSLYFLRTKLLIIFLGLLINFGKNALKMSRYPNPKVLSWIWIRLRIYSRYSAGAFLILVLTFLAKILQVTHFKSTSTPFWKHVCWLLTYPIYQVRITIFLLRIGVYLPQNDNMGIPATANAF